MGEVPHIGWCLVCKCVMFRPRRGRQACGRAVPAVAWAEPTPRLGVGSISRKALFTTEHMPDVGWVRH